MEKKWRMLYAEDDLVSAIAYTEVFEKAGFEIHMARDGDEAWEIYQSTVWDILVLDMDLPGKDGYELIKLIRGKGDVVPIVILSSLNHYHALYEGADEYLVKGMRVEEIWARLNKTIEHARHKKSSKELSICVVSSLTTFDHMTRLLSMSGEEYKLKATESRVLRLLSMRLNELCPKQEMCENIWGVHNETKERELARYISTLRKILSADPSIAIENDYADGYRLTVKENRY
ncbi:response regulator transcription factor [uncultured Sanguibacteroides sp.]|uniref:response regulator transcription factor n=1 Tax=uncultured Sanguibacteroides sp. TaxID=1635151 RepID=UPI0025E708DD|nr:response regulator transcription factor [uncultured Sanguibacteroides sp.]